MSFWDFVLVTMIWAAVLFLLASLFLWSIGYRFRREQNAYLYYPDEPSDSRRVCDGPAEAGLPNSETIAIETEDGVTLRGFLLWPFAVPNPSSTSTSAATAVGSTTNNNNNHNSGNAGGGKSLSSPLSGEGREVAGSSAASTSVNTQPTFVLIYFHGNAGNVGHRLPIAHVFVEKLHCAVLMMDYRGFGLSDDAEVDQEGLERDAQACLDFVLRDRRLPHEHIIAMGTSLGGAVTIHLAAKPRNARRLAAVIVENTFTSISDMTSAIGTQVIEHAAPCPQAMLCLFHYYIKPLVLRIGWCSVREVPQVAVPMLFLSGKKDELVPPAQMKQLYAAACRSESKKIRRFAEFSDGMHNNMPLMPGYLDTIQRFVTEVEQDRLVDVV